MRGGAALGQEIEFTGAADRHPQPTRDGERLGRITDGEVIAVRDGDQGTLAVEMQGFAVSTGDRLHSRRIAVMNSESTNVKLKNVKLH